MFSSPLDRDPLRCEMLAWSCAFAAHAYSRVLECARSRPTSGRVACTPYPSSSHIWPFQVPNLPCPSPPAAGGLQPHAARLRHTSLHRRSVAPGQAGLAWLARARGRAPLKPGADMAPTQRLTRQSTYPGRCHLRCQTPAGRGSSHVASPTDRVPERHLVRRPTD